MRLLSALGFWVTLLLGFVSCKEDVDDVPPRIVITSPESDIAIIMPDTITVAGEVEDDKELEFVNFGLVNQDLVQAGPRISVTSINNPLDFSLTLPVTDLDIETGPHFVEVFASDGNNDTRAYVEVQVTAIPREYQGLLFTQEQLGQEMALILREDGTLFTLYTGSNGILTTSNDRWNSIVILDEENNSLSSYDADSGLENWSIPSIIGSQDEIIELKNDPYSRSSRVLTSVPSILNFNKDGLASATVSLDAEWSPLLMYIDPDHIWVASETPSGYRVSQIFKASGFEVDFFIVPERPVQMERLSTDELILVDSNGDIRILETPTGGQYGIDTAAEPPVLDCIVAQGDVAYFITSEGLYRYSSSSFQAPLIYSGTDFHSLSYDDLGQRLVLSEGSSIGFYLLDPLQNAGSVDVGSAASELRVLFNK